MPDALRHVSIHCGTATDAGHGETIDLTVPAALTVGELLPWIVGALGAGDGTPRQWRLAHLGGGRLDESATLVQNDIRDGDLLILTDAADRPSIARTVIAALTAEAPQDGVPTALRVGGCLWACALGILALACAGLGSQGFGRICAAAVLAIGVTATALFAQRLDMDSTAVATLNIAALASAAILGFLVVPAGPAPANFFLAAVAASSLGAVLIRVSGCGTESLRAVVTATALIAVAMGCAALLPLSTPALGAVLSALGVGLLPLTPRLSITLAGLTPAIPGHPDGAGNPQPDSANESELRVRSGHRNLIGLVLGCAAAAGLGTGIVAVSGRQPVTAVEVAFTTAVGVAVLLRSRTYASGRCRAALTVGGFCALTASFVLVLAWAPAQGGWTGILAVGAGIALLGPVMVRHPVAGRAADAFEYGALAAVVPLACWLAGVFDLTRQLGPL
ncbi:type VII secretion integral membrane protein EccD [Mycobacterium frederiksbergense]|uniref:Type VII secretion integral membrane protein EccD n=1 Tax=Mycolicibacterium frederiksbergense TaxID=117567 RepID=A0ABT6L565_9MYCO|nr:type VII secretion integral membrane protein EccD [Mycolicibacterium frederiksbergense]MDH6197761.1 type VII secretion integral membrane protein EccD [Mycolicibacterium frederiksbergense]